MQVQRYSYDIVYFLNEISYSSSSPAPPRILISQEEDVVTNNEDRETNQSCLCLGMVQWIWNRLSFRCQRQEAIVRASSTFLRGNAEENQLVVMGPSEVGKTALVAQYLQNHFIEYYNPTQTEENYIHIIKTPGKYDISFLFLINCNGSNPCYH
ncbi:hypothetical protein TNCV_2828181 [Trichonephila clavipes]|nr:hypothetical protein TNCV_2828181 [Trichonephila clavipes]